MPLERPRCRWDDNIIIDFSEIGMGSCGVSASDPGYGPVAGSFEHVKEPSGSIKGGEFD
jgi:hypothetical protein